jgi:predicted transcriptional regulator
MIKENEGMRVFQAHLPVSLHRKLKEISKKFEISKSEIARKAIEAFLENPACKPEVQK